MPRGNHYGWDFKVGEKIPLAGILGSKNHHLQDPSKTAEIVKIQEKYELSKSSYASYMKTPDLMSFIPDWLLTVRTEGGEEYLISNRSIRSYWACTGVELAGTVKSEESGL